MGGQLLWRRRFERLGVGEHRGRDILGKGVITRRHTARDLQINRMITCPVVRLQAGHQARENVFPFLRRVWIGQTNGRQARLQAREMMWQAKQPSTECRDDFIYAVSEDESTVENGHLGLVGREKLPVEIYL